MNTVKWSVVVPEATDNALRNYLAGTGLKKSDLSRFVDQAVQLYLSDLVINKVKDRNAEFNQNDILTAIDEAVSHSLR